MVREQKARALIILEADQAEEAESLSGLLDQLYGQRVEVSVFCCNWEQPPKESIFHHYIMYSVPWERQLDSALATEALIAYCKKQPQDIILTLATAFGRAIAARLAVGLKAGLVADVTEADREEAAVLIRPAFRGKLFAAISCCPEGPMMASVRPGAFKAAQGWLVQKPSQERWMATDQTISSGGLRLLSQRPRPMPTDIRKSHLLVAGGNGAEKYFKKVEELAAELGGLPASSRALVDKGVNPRSIQVGHSGKVVKPRLYIAIGIFGSIQHIEGIKDVDHIIAVNHSADAPICSLADLVVEGDGEIFIDLLLKRIKTANKP